MSMLQCKCGYQILDQTDFLPYKGYIQKDQDADRFWLTLSEVLADFTQAHLTNSQQDWLQQHFGQSKKYPDTASVIYYIMMRYKHTYMVDIYECENCGRVWIQKGPRSNNFISYNPDDDRLHPILNSEGDQ